MWLLTAHHLNRFATFCTGRRRYSSSSLALADCCLTDRFVNAAKLFPSSYDGLVNADKRHCDNLPLPRLLLRLANPSRMLWYTSHEPSSQPRLSIPLPIHAGGSTLISFRGAEPWRFGKLQKSQLASSIGSISCARVSWQQRSKGDRDTWTEY
jgi:hypothetical protein